jgi:FkbH-like protein
MQVDRTGWLDTVVISAEDRTRHQMYDANRQRDALQTSAGDYLAYLGSLEQQAVIAPFGERHLDRLAQLTAKTNQFNLTTRRFGRAELAGFMQSESHLTAYVRLADRFGDNGLVSALVARGSGEDLWIDLWLMSCRVFNRHVEQLTCNHIVERARARGYRRLHGVYLPTAKNGLVKTLYGQLGFELAGPIEGGDHWTLELDRYRPFEALITVVDETSYERSADRG